MGVEFNPSSLRKKSILRDTSGNIINWLDEDDGGWIIRGRQVVNHEKWNAILKKEEDRRIAAQAEASATAASASALASRSGQTEIAKPDTKVAELEKKVNDMDEKLSAILKAVSNGK